MAPFPIRMNEDEKVRTESIIGERGFSVDTEVMLKPQTCLDAQHGRQDTWFKTTTILLWGRVELASTQFTQPS